MKFFIGKGDECKRIAFRMGFKRNDCVFVREAHRLDGIDNNHQIFITSEYYMYYPSRVGAELEETINILKKRAVPVFVIAEY